MSTRSIVEEYTRRAMALAIPEENEDGMIVARVPGFKGVYGYGSNALAALSDLSDVLQDWVTYRIQGGKSVPALGDIDFSDEESRRLAAC